MSNQKITEGAGQPPERKRDRRGFLAGVATGLAALGLRQVASGDPAMAADGSPLILGNFGNSASNTTVLTKDATLNFCAVEFINKATGNTSGGLYAESHAGGPFGAAVRAYNDITVTGGFGVTGEAPGSGGTGVYGKAPVGVHGDAQRAVGGIGVFGEASDTTSETYGVEGRTQGSKGRAVFGWSQATSGGTGVWGQSNNVTGAGVRGYAWDNGTGQFGSGVMGTSGSTAFPPPPPIEDTGVYGVSVGRSGGASSAGVVGESNTYAGVAGFTAAPGRAGGEFTNTAGGAALKVMGPAQFAQSGLLSIAAGTKSGTVTGVALRAASLVLATVQNPAGVLVENAAPNVTGSKITINLNKAVPAGKTAKVAWFVVN